ncbi:hypothetical protein V501_03941 [Pseudogymnoascus sp. VKM F-4519 (FW-2642)]|nr:hypothetical protein V501_03941 [Pseudogymnoascus sp. VKM F-4519 (FW-2642)]
MKVAIVGATGKTGTSIVQGLLASRSPHYLSYGHPPYQNLRFLSFEKKGVKILAANLSGPKDELAELLMGIDVVIATLDVPNFRSQIALASAAKVAGVKRFVPCSFATIVPPKGILVLQDTKEDVLNHIKRIHLPYTVIDIGWWFQLSLPRLPSGRIDYAVSHPISFIAGEGNIPSAITDLKDVGKYVARIIADPQTLNRMIFAYSEIFTQNQVYKLLERLSGETLERNYVSADAIRAEVAEADAKIAENATAYGKIVMYQYYHSWGVRGDNTPEYARYLGYIIAKELYPDLKGNTLAAYI